MDVYTFSENDQAMQAAELRKYFNEKGAEISLEPSNKGIEDEMHKIIAVCDATFSSADVPESEVQASLYSIVSVLMVMPTTEKTESLIVAFCEKLSRAPNYRNLGNVALGVLSVLFQASDICCMKYHIYLAMVQVSGQIAEIGPVYKSLDSLKSAMKEAQQPPSTEQVQHLLRLLHQALLANNMSNEASSVMLELLGTYTTENASQARDDAHRCIIASIADPKTFILDHLLSLKPVRFLEGELIHDLLNIFVNDKLSEYINFYNSHKEFISSIGLNHENNINKMMLLTFLQLAEENPEMSYKLLENELGLSEDMVEPFIIEAMRTKLLVVRMDQLEKTLTVNTVEHRTFGRAQWEAVHDLLLKWQSNLSLVKEHMHAIADATLTQ